MSKDNNNNNEPIEPTCPPGYHLDKSICKCVKDSGGPICPENYHWDTSLGRCIPDLEPPITPPEPPTCPEGQHWDPVTQKCVPDVVEPPEPGEGETGPEGIIWFLPEVKGKKAIMIPQSRDQADDDRWSENIAGCEDGFEQTMIAKSIGISGDGHFASKLGGSNHSGGGAAKERWMDLGVRSNGDIQLQWEGPHPSNHDFTLPDTKVFMKNIGKALEGNWIGLKWAQNILKKGGSPANGGVRWRMWVNTDIASDGKPDNSKWKLVLDFIDGVDVEVIKPQDFVMTGTMDCEVRRSNTKSHEVFGGGLFIRPFN